MTYRTGKTFAGRMDDLAVLTGIPRLTGQLAQDRQRRRHLRWPSIIALLLSTLGFGLTIVMPDRIFLGATMLWVVRAWPCSWPGLARSNHGGPSRESTSATASYAATPISPQ